MNRKKIYENTYLLFGSIFIIFVISLIQNLYFSFNPDSSWLITVAEELLSGKVLGVDLLETNPPLSSWLYVPGVLLAKLTGLRAEIGVSLVLYCLTFGICLFALALNERATLLSKSLMNGLCLFFVFVTCFYYQVHFGQREHFALILTLPYILVSSARSEKRTDNLPYYFFIISGLTMGIAGCIKPVFFIIPFLCNISYAFSRKSLKGLFWIENFIVVGTVLVYLFVVFVFYPEFIRYFNDFILVHYLPRYYYTVIQIIFTYHSIQYLFLLLTVCLLSLFFKPSILQKHLLLSSIGFFLAFLIQRKGFTYHTYPFLVLLYMACFLMCFTIIQTKTADFLKIVTLFVMGILVIQAATDQFTRWPVTQRARKAEAFVKSIVPHPKIASYAAIFGGIFPLVRDLDGTWVAPFHSIIFATLDPERQVRVLNGDYDAPYVEADKWLIRRISEDVVKNKPDIIMTDDWPQWMAFVLSVPEAKEALSGYVFQVSLDGLDIWVRKDLVDSK